MKYMNRMPQTKGQSLRQRQTSTTTSNLTTVATAESIKKDAEVDNAVVYEFGGPIGVTLMMLIFPVLMVYLWICVEFYGGILL